MRAVDIGIKNALGGMALLKASFKKNWKFYLQEALGLAIFMVSACFFSVLFFGKNGCFLLTLQVPARQSLLGIMMGLTALFIFYSPFTSPSGSHINPAVTFVFFRLRKIGRWDALFFMIFQVAGGTGAVYLMAACMGDNLSAAPLYDVVTVPGKYGWPAAAFVELIIAFVMMAMVLFTSDHPVMKKYTRIIAGALVCFNVIFAGPISGFGMNPARSFASAFPAHIWTSFWIYLFMPFAGMLGAGEVFLYSKKNRLTVDRF